MARQVSTATVRAKPRCRAMLRRHSVHQEQALPFCTCGWRCDGIQGSTAFAALLRIYLLVDVLASGVAPCIHAFKRPKSCKTGAIPPPPVSVPRQTKLSSIIDEEQLYGSISISCVIEDFEEICSGCKILSTVSRLARAKQKQTSQLLLGLNACKKMGNYHESSCSHSSRVPARSCRPKTFDGS